MASSSDKKKFSMKSCTEELIEAVVYTGGLWNEGPCAVEDTRNAVYKPYNGATIEKHHFKMPSNFTSSMLYEYVGRVIGSPPSYLTYVFHARIVGLPHVTYVPIGVTDDYDVTHFKDHVAKKLTSDNPIELYHSPA
ncbi:hypothetical protein R6Q59_015845 [Mikania micrantha]